MDPQTHKNVVEIAVLHEKLNGVFEVLDTIQNNELAHIAEDIKTMIQKQEEYQEEHKEDIQQIKETLQAHSEKFVQYDLAKKIVFGAVGIILVGVLGLIFDLIK